MSAPRDDGIEGLRGAIEAIDRSLIQLIARRVEAARGLGEIKRDLGLPTLDPAREAVIVRRAAQLAREEGLPEDPVRDIFWQIIGLSRRAQVAPPTGTGVSAQGDGAIANSPDVRSEA